ncbi:MAG TPA: hypothetical protein VFC21_07595 [Bryobacteraceae bacterium]|nr:hypothetical protein [Bryobacteraceae bacterium]
MKILFLIAGFCLPLFAQPTCIQISDSHIYGIGNLPMNGTITVKLGYTNVDGIYTFTQSDTILPVQNGTLYGPTGVPGYCVPPGTLLQAVYAVRRTGPGAIGSVRRASGRFLQAVGLIRLDRSNARSAQWDAL